MGKVACIILARGGSKGIPRKNVLDFCGKPLVAWSILQALGTPEIDEVYLSSDNGEILKVGEAFGAQLIKRPEEFATDTASPENAFVAPVDFLSNKAVATLKPNSEPIKWIGLHNAAYCPLSSTGTPYSLKHCSV